MSNKTDFQAKNARLNTNNTDLSSVLNIINNLPEYPEITLQSKTVTPTTSSQSVTADSGYDGLSKVTVNKVTSSIDSNITASNIKSGVSILGVTGTLVEGITPTGTLEITENGTHDVTNYASANVNVASSGGGKWQGFTAPIFFVLSDETFMTEGLILPIEVGKTYQVTLGHEDLGTSVVSFETECINDADSGVCLYGPAETGFAYSLDYAMAMCSRNYGVVLSSSLGMGYAVMSIEEV